MSGRHSTVEARIHGVNPKNPLRMNYLSIGLQANLCQCTFSSNSSSASKHNKRNHSPEKATVFVFPKHPCEKSNHKMDSNDSNMVQGHLECEHLLSEESSLKEEEQYGDQEKSTGVEEVEPLLQKFDRNSTEKTSCTMQNPSSAQQYSTLKQPLPVSGPSTEIVHRKDQHHHQIKRKFNFRSDSVFSDVLPSSSGHEYQKPQDEPEKSGSLSSLKPKESKWVTLRRKLKMNSSSSSSKDKEEKNDTAPEQKQTAKCKSGIHEKRSLFQRAKTLGILPVNKGLKEQREDAPSKKQSQSRQQHPPELFNVGGEMNLIPLELLIDVSDINISK